MGKIIETNNFDRLLRHLQDDSLAYRLVQAYLNRDISDPKKSMKAVLQDRLEQVRANIDIPKA